MKRPYLTGSERGDAISALNNTACVVSMACEELRTSGVTPEVLHDLGAVAERLAGLATSLRSETIDAGTSAEYLATHASEADEIITHSFTLGRTIAQADSMASLAELVVHSHSSERGAFRPDGDGVVLVDTGDGWRLLDDAELEAWCEALRDAWQGKAPCSSQKGNES